MKKLFTHFSCVLLTSLFLLPWSGIKAQTLKIGDNSSSNSYAPVYVTWADKYYCSQQIYSATELATLNGKQITKLAFHLRATTGNSKNYDNVQIRIKEVNFATFASAAYESIEGATLVFEGTLPASTSTTLEATFSAPFIYGGGNLLVDVRKTVTGGGYAPSSSSGGKGRFQSSTASNTVLYNYSSSSFPTTCTRGSNRSDITFTYEDASSSSCSKPGTPVASDITATSATLSWTAAEGVTNYQFLCVAQGLTPNWSGVTPQAVTTVTLDDLTKFTNYDFYVRSYCGSGEGEQSAAEKVSFKTLKSCYEPTSLGVVDAQTTSTSAKITWSASGHGETQWQYTYEVFDDEVPDWTSAVVTDQKEATLSGLTPSTPYQVWVRSYCGASDQSEAITAYFTTDCAAISSVGFDENFDAVTPGSGKLPDCWKNIGGNFPYVRSFTTYAYSGSQYLYFYGGVTGTSEQIAILPAFIEATSSLTISFYYTNATPYQSYTGTAYGSISVGYITDISDASTFTAKETLSKVGSYTEAEVLLSGAPVGSRIAIRYSGGSSNGEAFVENISIARTPTCFKPASITINSSTYNSVDFSWVESGHGETQWQYVVVDAGTTPSSWSAATSSKSASVSGLTTGTSYEVCIRSYCGPSDQSEFIRSAAFTPTCQVPTGVTVGMITSNSAQINWTANNGESKWSLQYRQGTGAWNTVENITSKPYTLSGLTASSNYEVKVAADDVCNSEYSETASFTTQCVAIGEANLPYENNFESETVNSIPSCWSKTPVDGEYPAVVSGSAAYGESGKCLGFIGNSTQTAILPAFETSIKKLTIVFYYKHSNYCDLQIGYIKSDDTFVLKETLPIRSSYNPISPYEVNMTDWGDEIVNIAFRMTNTTSDYAWAYIDNVVVEKTPTCFKPATLNEATDITASAATLTWTASGHGETQYQYICVPSGETPDWTSGDVVLTSSLSATLTGLTPNTNYDFYLRSYCAADDQSEVLNRSFTTICGKIATLAWDHGFEEDVNNSLPGCWKLHAATYYNAFVASEIPNAHSGSKSLAVTAPKTAGNETYVVLPGFEASLTSYDIAFWYKGTTGATIQVGYLTDANDKGTFEALSDALTASSSYQRAVVSLAGMVLNPSYIAIRFKGASSDGDFYIDDIRVARIKVFEDLDEFETGKDNETRLGTLYGQTIDFIMARPILSDGDYNTICLPFDLSASQLSDAKCPLNGFEIRKYDHANVDLAADQVDLFLQTVNGIEAGKAYFIRNLGEHTAIKTYAEFRDVVISASEVETPAKDAAGIIFKGAFNPSELAGGDAKNLYLSTGSLLYYPNSDFTIKGFRAYVLVAEGSAALPVIRNGARVRISEPQDAPTGVDNVQGNKVQCTKVLEEGQVVIIRNGVKYTLQGQIIK